MDEAEDDAMPAGWHPGLLGASRTSVLQALRHNPAGLDARELGEACGLHVTTVRFHLRVLRQAGLVETTSEHGGRRGRPRMIYTLSRADDAGVDTTSGYPFLASVLASQWATDSATRARRAERAGHAAATPDEPDPVVPARNLSEAADRVGATFSRLGFAPQVVHEGPNVVLELHACPFREVAQRHPEVVCSLHLGLLRGALERMDAPVKATSLEPFARPHLCIARLEGSTHPPAPDRSVSS